MKRTFPLCFLAFALPFSNGLGQEKKPKIQKAAITWIDPAKAAAENPDFLIQGEYGAATEGQPWGAQVVALGDGKFDCYLLEGGLPGLGWTREKKRTKLTGLAGKLEGNGMTASIADDKITLPDGTQLPRIERTSPTLGAAAPEGAIVLFDGTHVDAWNKGTLVDGLLKNTDPITKQKFGSYSIHLEFRTPYKPYARGQARGNSGVYHQGRFETQVLDSFGLEGKMNETGGIYSIAAPIINACLPPLTWQTYDVDLTAARYDESGKKIKNARMTVRLNGVLVQDDVEITKTTPSNRVKESTESGPIYLQSHGNPVFYRNIWLIEK